MYNYNKISDLIFDFLGDWNDLLPEDNTWTVWLYPWEKETLAPLYRAVLSLNNEIFNTSFVDHVYRDLKNPEMLLANAVEKEDIEMGKKAFRELVFVYRMVRAACQKIQH